jgi:hypothetical protein
MKKVLFLLLTVLLIAPSFAQGADEAKILRFADNREIKVDGWYGLNKDGSSVVMQNAPTLSLEDTFEVKCFPVYTQAQLADRQKKQVQAAVKLAKQEQLKMNAFSDGLTAGLGFGMSAYFAMYCDDNRLSAVFAGVAMIKSLDSLDQIYDISGRCRSSVKGWLAKQKEQIK